MQSEDESYTRRNGSAKQALVWLRCQQVDHEWGCDSAVNGIQLRLRCIFNVNVGDAAVL